MIAIFANELSDVCIQFSFHIKFSSISRVCLICSWDIIFLELKYIIDSLALKAIYFSTDSI
jgi:hypothetical protein